MRKAAQRVLHLLLARQRELVARRVERGLDLAAAAQAEHGHDAVDGLPARDGVCIVCVYAFALYLLESALAVSCIKRASASLFFAGELSLAELICCDAGLNVSNSSAEGILRSMRSFHSKSVRPSVLRAELTDINPRELGII